MNVRFLILAALGLAAVLGGISCEARRADSDSPFQEDGAEYVLAVVLDFSGSFHHQMLGDDARAYRFFLQLVNRFYRQRLGSQDYLIIGQISAREKGLLWAGHPRKLRQEFPDGRTFKEFLEKRSSPEGSRVHDSIADAIDRTLDRHVPGKTRSLVVVFSDMEDNTADPSRSEARLRRSLAAFGKAGGAVGLYWVSDFLVPKWRENLREAGVRRAVIEADIRSDPPLPTFD